MKRNLLKTLKIFKSDMFNFQLNWAPRVTTRPPSRPMPSPSTIKAITEEKAEEAEVAAAREQETLM